MFISLQCRWRNWVIGQWSYLLRMAKNTARTLIQTQLAGLSHKPQHILPFFTNSFFSLSHSPTDPLLTEMICRLEVVSICHGTFTSRYLASRYSLEGNNKQCLILPASKSMINPLAIDRLLLPPIMAWLHLIKLYNRGIKNHSIVKVVSKSALKAGLKSPSFTVKNWI